VLQAHAVRDCYICSCMHQTCTKAGALKPAHGLSVGPHRGWKPPQRVRAWGSQSDSPDYQHRRCGVTRTRACVYMYARPCACACVRRVRAYIRVCVYVRAHLHVYGMGGRAVRKTWAWAKEARASLVHEATIWGLRACPVTRLCWTESRGFGVLDCPTFWIWDLAPPSGTEVDQHYSTARSPCLAE
jgi:hypothetical protein